jgi:hypothetical protein
VASLVSERVALAGVEEELRCLRSQAPERTWTLNPRSGVHAFKAAGSSQADGGIESADCNANLGVGGGGAALGRGNVGAALEQLRRHADGNLRQGEIEWRRRNAEL